MEDASRFARDLMAQELGIRVLIKLGMRVVTANGDDLVTRSRELIQPGLRSRDSPPAAHTTHAGLLRDQEQLMDRIRPLAHFSRS